MSNWAQKKFDIEADNDNYTCLSTSNSVGPSVKSSTYFSIECKYTLLRLPSTLNNKDIKYYLK